MTALSPREELIRIQKQIFRKNQKIIDESILVSEQGFAKYEQNYLKHVRNFESLADVEDLKKALAAAEWIYLGDYHTNRQSQRALLRLLKMLVVQTDRFVICLEFLQKRHQVHADKFLRGQLSLRSFLKLINLRKHFYFDLWENFEPIFDFAKYYQIDVYGIESAPLGAGLRKRDEAMAKTLAEIDALNPGFKKFVFVGDLHIAPENLPHQVREAAGKGYNPRKELFIYQNSEKIYWQLAEDHLEDKIELVRLDGKSFCLMNTPPIVWQQSYLNWLENEEGEIDYQDPKHSFLDLSERIAKFLGLKLPKAKDEVEVFTCGDLSFLERLKEDPDFSPQEKRMIRRQVQLSESYYIPKHKWVYLANVSMNHAAEEASHFIRHLVAGDEFPRSAGDAFYANALHEAIGFFGSKIINQKRKCMRVEDFESLIGYFKNVRVPRDRTFELEVAHTVLEAKKLEKKGVPVANPEALFKRHELFFGVTHALGYMLGELLYHAMVQGKFTKREILRLFRDPFREEGAPFKAYSKLVKKFKNTPLPQRI
ncbi:MAG TPA: ChaN family lipoprotein [bacterium]|nr:ChaN family lipoprotein [bacterium]